MSNNPEEPRNRSNTGSSGGSYTPTSSHQSSYNDKLYSLRRSMGDEADRMLDTSLNLESQSRSLIKTTDLYNDYSGKLDTSNRLNKQLKETHKKNRIRVYGSFYFFLAVVAYIWLSRLGFFYIANLIISPFTRLFGNSQPPQKPPVIDLPPNI